MNDHALDMLLSTAVGILMERFELSPEGAADRLGDMARQAGASAGDIARELVLQHRPAPTPTAGGGPVGETARP